MPKVDEKAEAFFSELLSKHPYIFCNREISEDIISLSQELKYAAPIRAVLYNQQKRARRLSKEIQGLPLGDQLEKESRLMTLEEISALGLGHSPEEIKAILEQRKDVFIPASPKPEANPSDSQKSDQRYAVSYFNVHFLDKDKITSADWLEKMAALQLLNKQIAYTNHILRNLEARCIGASAGAESAPGRAQTASIILQEGGIPVYLERPVEMTIAEIKVSGSHLSERYISRKIKHKKDQIASRKDGKLLKIKVDRNNYHLLGLPGQRAEESSPSHQHLARQEQMVRLLPSAEYSLKKLQTLSRYAPQSLYIMIHNHPELFLTRMRKVEGERGKGLLYVQINEQNQQKLKLNLPPAAESDKSPRDNVASSKPELSQLLSTLAAHTKITRRPSSQTFIIGDREQTFSYESPYRTTIFASNLRQLHSGAFTEDSIESALDLIEAGNGTIEGKEAIALLEGFSGMMLLSSKST